MHIYNYLQYLHWNDHYDPLTAANYAPCIRRLKTTCPSQPQPATHQNRTCKQHKNIINRIQPQ